MRIENLLALLKRSPLIASVQADEGTPLDDPGTLLRLAQASISQGVAVLRLQGVENIRTIRGSTSVPTIGLIKKSYPDSEVYITPTSSEVDALIELGCEVIALDATERARPGGARLDVLIQKIHGAGKLAMADCDTPASIHYALQCGADLIGTTLSGYTPDSPKVTGPDFNLLQEAVLTGRAVIAEGRFTEPWEITAAKRLGALAVVVGGALNDPVKQSKKFLEASSSYRNPVGAVDIGGTWLRFAMIDETGVDMVTERVPTPLTFKERLDWIFDQASVCEIDHIGISSGGTIDPATLVVTESKPIISDNEGRSFMPLRASGIFKVVRVLNDGLATAWGHYCHPRFAGKRVATLALGTGVGFGLVDKGQILMSPYGGYPRLNDVPMASGETFEELLGGAALTPNPTEEQKVRALEAGRFAVQLIQSLYYPDEIVVCGGVGLSDWLELGLPKSPYGADAGLYGAEALVRYKPF